MQNNQKAIENGDVEKAFNALSQRQKLFVEHYLQSNSYAQAARESGYSKKHPSQCGKLIANRPLMKWIIAEKQKQQVEKLRVGRNVLLEDLLKMKDKAIEEGDNPTALKCIAEIAKITGLYSQTGNGQLNPALTQINANRVRVSFNTNFNPDESFTNGGEANNDNN